MCLVEKTLKIEHPHKLYGHSQYFSFSSLFVSPLLYDITIA